jgi:hypothetical protein
MLEVWFYDSGRAKILYAVRGTRFGGPAPADSSSGRAMLR